MLETAVGRLYLAAGDVEHARAWLEQAVALRRTVDVPESPWLAEAQSALDVASRPGRKS